MRIPLHPLENDDPVCVQVRTTCDLEFATRSVQLSVEEPFAVHVTRSRTGTSDDRDCRGLKIFGSPIEYVTLLIVGTFAYKYLPGHAV